MTVVCINNGMRWSYSHSQPVNMMLLLLKFLMLVFLLHDVHAGGKISVKFVKYSNPSGTGANGHCCDGKWGACQDNGCDNVFKICLGDELSDADDMEDCVFGSYETSDFPDQNSINFSADMKSVANPVSFDFDSITAVDAITPVFLLKVSVEDYDGWMSSSDQVDTLSQVIRLQEQQETLQLTGQSTTLDVIVSVECSLNHYGPQCVFCAPSNRYTCKETGGIVCNQGWTGTQCEQEARTTTPAPPPVYQDRDGFDCETRGRYFEFGMLFDDVWSINPRPNHPSVLTHCDMDSYGNGWTLIQRNDGEGESFDRTWEEFKRGFGDPSPNNNFWIGLDTIYYLTNARDYKLRIKMTIGTMEEREAVYSSFHVSDEAGGYRLFLDGYSGFAGDAFNKRIIGSGPQNGQKFTSRDSDNDQFPQGNCAQRYNSGWWYSNCFQNNLNGEFVPVVGGKWPECKDHRCISWNTMPGYEKYSLLGVQMWILPSNLSYVAFYNEL